MDTPQGYIDVRRDDGSTVALTVSTYTLVPTERLAANIRANLPRALSRFVETSGRASARIGEPIAIVSCGHSLNERWDELRQFRNILVCGSAHDHVVRQGIVPTYAVVCDAGVEDKGNLSLPQAETLYLIASQCDPALFDQLAGHRVEMWHYRGQAVAKIEDEPALLNGEQSICWGSTATLVSINIAMMMGFQHQHFFGFDNCYAPHGASYHACDVAGEYEYEKKPVWVGKRFFVSNLALMTQVEQFFRLVENWREFLHVTLHGDGLTSEMVRQGEPGLEKFVSLA